jgi:hypothetical protein
VLNRGERLVLLVTIPVEGDMPLEYEFSDIKVHDILGAAGPVSEFQVSDIKTFLLDVPQSAAAELQAALSAKNATVTYRIVNPFSSNTLTPIVPLGFLHVTVPMDRATAGTGPLVVNDRIDLFIYTPAGEGEPFDELSFLNLKVIRLLSINGSIAPSNWETLQGVVVEVRKTKSASLLQALANEEKIIEFRRLPGKATNTPPVTSTSTPVRPMLTSIPTLLPGWAYVHIPVSQITQLGDFVLDKPMDGQLVIVHSKADEPDMPYLSSQFCVQVVAFLNENGVAESVFEKEHSKQLVVALNAGDLGQYGVAMADPVSIYLVPNSTCNAIPTGTATLTATATR